jgi:hypothetical protein
LLKVGNLNTVVAFSSLTAAVCNFTPIVSNFGRALDNFIIVAMAEPGIETSGIKHMKFKFF